MSSGQALPWPRPFDDGAQGTTTLITGVTLSAATLADAMRLGDSTADTATARRLLAVGTALVERHAPGAPCEILNESVIRVAGYLYDQPQAPGGAGYANALRNSGAAALLLPFRAIRAGNVAAK